MKSQTLFQSSISIFVFLAFFVSCVILVGAEAGASSKKITLRIVYEQPITDNGHTLYKIWQERVNAVAPERLHIKYLGAYEVVPTFEQMEAVMRGTVDMAVLAPTFYSGLLPESMAIQCLGPVATVPEVRKSGMIDLMDKMHRAKLGVAFLGGGLWAGELRRTRRQIGHVQGAHRGVNESARAHEQRRAHAVDGDVLERFPELRLARSDHHHAVGAEEHHLVGDEEVEEIPGKKGPVDAQQDYLKERIEEVLLLGLRDGRKGESQGDLVIHV